jgi:hypothetical protein
VHDQYACLNDVLLPALAAAGIEVLDQKDWDAGYPGLDRAHFLAEVEPVLSPLGLDPARPFPRIQNKSLNFIVRLSGKDAYGRDSELAIVQAPRSLPRIVALPDGGGRRRFVALSTIVESLRGAPVRGRAGTGLLSVPAHAQQRPVRRRRRSRRPAARARRRARAAPLRRRGAPRDRRQLPQPTWSSSCCSSSR